MFDPAHLAHKSPPPELSYNFISLYSQTPSDSVLPSNSFLNYFLACLILCPICSQPHFILTKSYICKTEVGHHLVCVFFSDFPWLTGLPFFHTHLYLCTCLHWSTDNMGLLLTSLLACKFLKDQSWYLLITNMQVLNTTLWNESSHSNLYLFFYMSPDLTSPEYPFISSLSCSKWLP